MRSVLKPLVLLLAVPVAVSALAAHGRAVWEARWTVLLARQLVAQGQRPTGRFMARFSLAALCGDPRTARQIGPCRAYIEASRASAGSAVVAGAGLVFLGLVGVGGSLARTSRRARARAFRPALILASGVTVGLAVAHAALAVFGFSLAGQVVAWWPSSLTLAAALGALGWVVGVIGVAVAVNRTASITVLGRPLDLGAQLRLATALQRVADQTGVKPPDRVVAGLAPGHFLTEAPVSCLDGTLRGRTLYVSLPMCRILTEAEFGSLAAHEMGHFQGAGEPDERRAAIVERGVVASIDGFRARAHGIPALAVLPALALIDFVAERFRAGARDGAADELAADRVAAAQAGTQTYAAALVKVHAFERAWPTVLRAMGSAVAGGSQYENASELFAEIARANRAPGRLSGVGTLRAGHPFDTFPTLATRLSALGVRVEDVAAQALSTDPSDAAILLFDGYRELERELSVAEHHLASLAGDQDTSNTPRAQAMASG
jgi:Zn-dependent protease with chaperone function